MIHCPWDRVKALYGVETLCGYSQGEVATLKEKFDHLPEVLENFYSTAGKTEALHHVQDQWISPIDFRKWDWLNQSDYFILLNENQGVCRAGIRRKDLHLPDPPVYYTEDDENWTLCAPTTTEFLLAALCYESVFTFPYSLEEFYYITEEEYSFIESHLQKLPFQLEYWVSDMKITLYSTQPDNMVAIMDCGEDDISMLYGAVSESSYKELCALLENIGEPM